MQYALIEIQDRPILIDANEYGALNLLRETPVIDEPVDEGALVWKLVYGSFKPNRDRDAEEALGAMREQMGVAWGRIIARDGLCRWAEVKDVETFEPIRRGHAMPAGHAADVPVAVLLATRDEIPPADEQGLTLFPRYASQMDPLTNVLNRPGLLCLKGEEKRVRKQLNPLPPEDWRSLIDRERAVRTAGKCY